VSDDLPCEVCGSVPSAVVVASTFGAISYATCMGCARARREPWYIVVAATVLAGGVESLSPWARAAMAPTLAHMPRVPQREDETTMRRVVIESPYTADKKKMPTELDEAGQRAWIAAEVEENLRYLRAAMHDCLVHRDESPFASHGLYTQPGVLDDDIPIEREKGIKAGFEWRHASEVSAFYVDRGMSTGMRFGLTDALEKGRAFEYRAFLDGLDQPSYTINFEAIGDKVHADAPKLPAGLVTRTSISEAVEALREIAAERRKA